MRWIAILSTAFFAVLLYAVMTHGQRHDTRTVALTITIAFVLISSGSWALVVRNFSRRVTSRHAGGSAGSEPLR